MEDTKKLQNFFDKFKSFKTKSDVNPFSSQNASFNFPEWIDELKDDLFANDFKLADDALKQSTNTPYVEFQYAWDYVKEVLSQLETHFTWSDQVYPNEVDYYALQNLSTFVYSLLNRLTMDRYVLSNEDYLVTLTKELTKEGYHDQQLGLKIRDKLKRVTFSNWRYNPLIKEFDKCYLWDRFLKESRNVNEHYGVLFKTGDPSKFNETPSSFYAEIILEIYIFLFYVKFYSLKLKEAHIIHKKEF